MQPVGTIWTILVGKYTGIIPVQFGHIPINGLGAVISFPYLIPYKNQGGVDIDPRGIISVVNVVRGPQGDVPNIKALGIVVLDKTIFENLIL